jgi:hypothetical protein
MILTKDFIQNISYVETYSRSGFISGRSSYIKIHFKKWYKWPKTIKFDWICISCRGGELTYEEPEIYHKTLKTLMDAIGNASPS